MASTKKIDKRFHLLLEEAQKAADSLLSEMTQELERLQEYYDERSDAWKAGDKGEAFQNWLEDLDEQVLNIQRAFECLEEVVFKDLEDM